MEPLPTVDLLPIVESPPIVEPPPVEPPPLELAIDERESAPPIEEIVSAPAATSRGRGRERGRGG